MITDEERRKVVRELRKRSHMVSVQSVQHQLHEILGVGGTEIFGMLADLIEPQASEQTNPQESSLSTSLCGRDALLALADWMDRDVAETEKHFSNVISTRSVSDYACRIREACAEAGAEPPKPEDMTTCSAYDLISEEDRKTLRWVRDHGGLRPVQNEVSNYATLCRSIQDADNRRIEMCSILGIDVDTGWSDACEELRNRLIPESYEWPRYEDGDPVKLGDMALIDGELDMVEQVSLTIQHQPVIVGDGGSQQLARGERVKRPTVLAADGDPLEVGQTVWRVDTGHEYVVVEPSYGDTVVVRLAKYDDAEGEQYTPDQLTHTKPEQDSWERIEEDAKKDRCSYFGAKYQDCGRCTQLATSCSISKACDIVRRCKALAGRDAS